MQTDYDVIIVGGGLVGASLACALAAGPTRVALIEAIPYGAPAQPSYDDRTVALSYASKLIFSALEVWPHIEADSIAPIHAIHISDRGRLGTAHLDRGDVGTDALGYVVNARALGAALIARLKTKLNVTLIAPATLSGLAIETNVATVTLLESGPARTLSAKLIVGADGAQSRVRELLAIPAHQRDYGQTAIVTTITPERPHEHIAYERFTASGPLALLPRNGGRCAAVWSVPPTTAKALMQLPDAEFLTQLNEAFGARLGNFTRLGKRQSYPLILTKVDRHHQGRAVLIGNAAHSLHPVAGQGFNLGLRDVALLAEMVLDALRAGHDIGAANLLQRYVDLRRRDTQATTAFTDGLARLFSNTRAPLVFGRNLSLLAVDMVPAMKRALLRRTMGLAGHLPRVLRGLPL